MIPACEIMVNSPKISKHIEHGEIKEIYNEIESSVGYYRMQTMNQSLIALLVNGVITYDVARERSLDPEDLSLKLRKMFPKIEEAQREGAPMPAPGDFAQIVELMEIKKLYEEQEERWKLRYLEKDEQITLLGHDLAELRQEASTTGTTLVELRNQLEAARADRERLVQEANLRIDKLNERIRELNQQLVGTRGAAAAPPPPEKPPSGFFKR